MIRSPFLGTLVLFGVVGCAAPGALDRSEVSVIEDPQAATLSFSIGGREACVYQFNQRLAIPHIWPLRSPSGKSLLVQHPQPFPHHRSLWIVDRVQLEDGPITDFYHQWKNLHDAEQPQLGHHSFIRHDSFSSISSGKGVGTARAELTWIAGGNPVLAQSWTFELLDLGNSEYMLNLAWELRAEYGEVKFHSDWVHYAWPYLRMDPSFSGEQGGTIVDDQGRRGQEATNEKHALWVDYSNTVQGLTEGLTVFTPDDGKARKWLTREYGTFGPRRPDELSGIPFRLKRGEAVTGQVKILVHSGNAEQAQTAERYQDLLWH